MHNKARAMHMHSACYDRSRFRTILIGLTTTALSGVRIMADSDNTTTLPLVTRRRVLMAIAICENGNLAFRQRDIQTRGSKSRTPSPF
ncbi:MAG: hypothetical protein EOS55_24695 [Mesorhizobium sp.]|nr:MAG: hypothetical protein EOS55_24695 [Mesorhizobium sp.]